MESLILAVDAFLRIVTGVTSSRRQPYSRNYDCELSFEQRRRSVSLLRINHVGEVCAQGLYRGQMLASRDPLLKEQLLCAAYEEFDHLSWCLDRLRELNASPSNLLFLWYLGSFLIGFLAGLCGDCWSLGFLEETERQVTKHLDEHLELLGNQDPKSTEIFSVMRTEEARHQEHARLSGARELPVVIRKTMWRASRIMVLVSPVI